MIESIYKSLGSIPSASKLDLSMLSPSLSSNILFWSISAGVLVLLAFAYNIVYQLFFSPLAWFPGPRFWAISRVPNQWSVFRGYAHLDATALHERYGPVIRVGPNELVFNTPRAFRDIYGARPGGCFQKDPSRYLAPANGVNHLIGEIDNASHARQRKLLAPAFSDRALREQEPIITGYVDTMISKLRAKIQNGSSVLDIKNWMNYTTFDITGDLMFGESFGCLKDSQLHPWVDLIFKSIKALAYDGMARQFPAFHKLLSALIPKRVKQKAVEHFDLAARRVDRRLETKTTRSDFMSAILQNGLSESKEQDHDRPRMMTRAEIHSNAFILIVAGSETSATLLCGCIFYLCTNPRAMSHVVGEIRSAFHSAEDITFRRSAALPYLSAVIEESLRMYPPFVTSLARIIPAGGASVDGHFVPEGTVVSCHHYASYRSTSNFALPNNFIPERWLGNDPRFDGDKKDVLQPFSLGPRGCLGKTLAYCEIRLILSNLFYNFDLTLCPESADWVNQKVYFLWDKPTLMVTLRDRFSDQNRENA